MIIALLAAAATPVPKVEHRVKVDDRTYRVTVTGPNVEVAEKSMVVKRTVETRDRMRRAVTAATGCSIVDELPMLVAKLEGRLSCPPSAPQASAD